MLYHNKYLGDKEMDDNKVVILGEQHRCDDCKLVGQCFKCPHYNQKYVDNLFKAVIKKDGEDDGNNKTG